MSDTWQQRRPRLAYPFTVLTSANTVRLIAGEDFRYTLTAPDLDRWLPPLIERFTGRETVPVLVNGLTPSQREAAFQIINHLYGERVLVDGSACDAHVPSKYRVVFEGVIPFTPSPSPPERRGENSAHPPASPPELSDAPRLTVLVQDRLDYEEALRCNRRCRDTKTPLLWVSYAPLNRAYVSPLFLPDAGPCFGCLLRSFHRLSPAPEIYDALREHARQGKPIEPVEFPHEAHLILQGIVRWKLQQAELEMPGPALYRLHVLEREHFEVSTHRVFVDPFCPECGKERS